MTYEYDYDPTDLGTIAVITMVEKLYKQGQPISDREVTHFKEIAEVSSDACDFSTMLTAIYHKSYILEGFKRPPREDHGLLLQLSSSAFVQHSKVSRLNTQN